MSKGEEAIEAYLRDNVEIDIACAVAMLELDATVSGIDWEEEYRVEYERKVRGGEDT